eukprot:2604085-Pleurochrysis_carterae.AAC.1
MHVILARTKFRFKISPQIHATKHLSVYCGRARLKCATVPALCVASAAPTCLAGLCGSSIEHCRWCGKVSVVEATDEVVADAAAEVTAQPVPALLLGLSPFDALALASRALCGRGGCS